MRVLRKTTSHIRRLLMVLLGLVILLVVSTAFFRLDAMLAPVNLASKQAFLFMAFSLGLILRLRIFSSHSRRVRKTLLVRNVLISTAVFVALIILYSRHVIYEDTWPRAYTISTLRTDACNEGPCPIAVDNEQCIEILLAFDDPKKIDSCWEKEQVQRIEVALACLYFLFSASLGGIAGLEALPKPPIRAFVSYRTDDSAGLVRGALAKALREHFGRDNVFVDQHAIDSGENWARRIRLFAKQCDAFVVVIGKKWVEELEAKAEAREKDWVRYEIVTALARGVGLVPFVFGGAGIPAGKELPREIAGLARTQAVVLEEGAVSLENFEIIDQDKFDAAVDEMILAIEKYGDRS